MKKIYLLFTITLLSLCLWAQSPQRFSYQAVIRNASNQLLANGPVGMRISILQGSATGTAMFVETHSTMTNGNGLVSLEIGGGTLVSGDLSSINWGQGPFFIKTETDIAGGTNYTISGTTQMMSVPYALYAERAGSSVIGANPGDMMYWDGTSWVIIPIGTQGQTLTICNGIPTWGTGNCPQYTVGDTGQAGGLIFYDKGFYSNGWRYLEAAPADLGEAEWGCYPTWIGGTSPFIGTGQLNTTRIIAACTTAGIAARICDEAVINGYSDWFLPSKDELEQMWGNLYLNDLGDFEDGEYWSSTEFQEWYGWAIFFPNGDQHSLDKNLLKNVRPARRF